MYDDIKKAVGPDQRMTSFEKSFTGEILIDNNEQMGRILLKSILSSQQSIKIIL